MSKLAQDVQDAVDNMVATDGDTKNEPSEGDDEMTKKKSATRRRKTQAKRKPRQAKVVKESKRLMMATAELLPIDLMRLGPAGVSAHGPMYVRLAFGELNVLLKPVNLDNAETSAMRDRLVEWLKKRLAS